MTKEAFTLLSPLSQEQFLNNGGILSSVEAPPVEATSTIAPGEKTVESDVIGISSDQPSTISDELEQWTQGFDIKDPVELLYVLDEKIRSGEVKLHPWQIRFMLDFSNTKHTKNSPFQATVQACNSSGKDKYIIAACAVWLCMRYSDTYCPITSSSGDQLDSQTGVHIDRLCHSVNSIFGKVWKIQYRYYELQHKDPNTGMPKPSMMKLFATDEAGKAEGYHPIDAGKQMAIFTSETKSIPEDIIEAIERCHGFTHRTDVSSPGLSAGYFYNMCTSGIPRKTISDIKSLKSTESINYEVDYCQCPHITEEEAERMASKLVGGRSNPVFISSMLAKFTTTDEMVVIKSDHVWRAIKTPAKWLQESFNTAGLDLSDGGAETVLSIRNGNKLLKEIPFRIFDELKKIEFLEQQFQENELNHSEALIFGDFTGIGGPTLKMLKSRGWDNIRFVDSRHKAKQPKTYANCATELFFHMALLLDKSELDLSIASKLLIQQLCTRYYKLTINNIHALLSKQEQRSRGYPSPDRADSLNLCFWNYKSTVKESYVDFTPSQPTALQDIQKPVGNFSLKQWSNKDGSSLAAFQRNVSKRRSIEYLQKRIDRYCQSTIKSTNQ